MEYTNETWQYAQACVGAITESHCVPSTGVGNNHAGNVLLAVMQMLLCTVIEDAIRSDAGQQRADALSTVASLQGLAHKRTLSMKRKLVHRPSIKVPS